MSSTISDVVAYIDLQVRGVDKAAADMGSMSAAIRRSGEEAKASAAMASISMADVEKTYQHAQTTVENAMRSAGVATSKSQTTVVQAAKAMSTDLEKTGVSAGHMGSELEKAGGKSASFGSAVRGINANLALASSAFTLAGGAIAAWAIKGAQDWSAQESHVLAFTSTTKAQLPAVEAQIKSLSLQTGVSATQMMGSYYNIASSISDAKKATMILADATKFSAATNTDARTSTELLTGVVNAYGIHTKDVTLTQDRLSMAVKIGAAEARDLAPALAQIVPIAAHLGVGVDQLGAYMAVMTNHGLSAAEAGNYLGNMLTQLSAPTRQQIKAVESLGGTYNDLRIHHGDVMGTMQRLNDLMHQHAPTITDIEQRTGATAKQAGVWADQMSNADGRARMLFGGNWEAAKSFFSLMNDGGKAAADALAHMAKAAGETDRDLKIAMDSSAKHVQQFQAALELLRIQLGQALLPAFTAALGGLTDFIVEMETGKGKGGEFMGMLGHVHDALVGYDEKVRTASTSLNQLGQKTGEVNTTLVHHEGLIETVRKAWDEATNHGSWLRDMVDSIRGNLRDLGGAMNTLMGDLGLLDDHTDHTTARFTIMKDMLLFVKWVLVEPLYLAIKFIIVQLDLLVDAIDKVVNGVKRLGDAFGWLGDHIGQATSWINDHVIHSGVTISAMQDTTVSASAQMGKAFDDINTSAHKNLADGVGTSVHAFMASLGDAVTAAGKAGDGVTAALAAPAKNGTAYDAGKQVGKSYSDGIMASLGDIANAAASAIGDHLAITGAGNPSSSSKSSSSSSSNYGNPKGFVPGQDGSNSGYVSDAALSIGATLYQLGSVFSTAGQVVSKAANDIGGALAGPTGLMGQVKSAASAIGTATQKSQEMATAFSAVHDAAAAIGNMKFSDLVKQADDGIKTAFDNLENAIAHHTGNIAQLAASYQAALKSRQDLTQTEIKANMDVGNFSAALALITGGSKGVQNAFDGLVLAFYKNKDGLVDLSGYKHAQDEANKLADAMYKAMVVTHDYAGQNAADQGKLQKAYNEALAKGEQDMRKLGFVTQDDAAAILRTKKALDDFTAATTKVTKAFSALDTIGPTLTKMFGELQGGIGRIVLGFNGPILNLQQIFTSLGGTAQAFDTVLTQGLKAFDSYGQAMDDTTQKTADLGALFSMLDPLMRDASQGLQQLGDGTRQLVTANQQLLGMIEQQKSAYAGLYNAQVTAAKQTYDTALANYENAKAAGVSGAALLILWNKAIDAGVALGHLTAIATDVQNEVNKILNPTNGGSTNPTAFPGGGYLGGTGGPGGTYSGFGTSIGGGYTVPPGVGFGAPFTSGYGYNNSGYGSIAGGGRGVAPGPPSMGPSGGIPAWAAAVGMYDGFNNVGDLWVAYTSGDWSNYSGTSLTRAQAEAQKLFGGVVGSAVGGVQQPTGTVASLTSPSTSSYAITAATTSQQQQAAQLAAQQQAQQISLLQQQLAAQQAADALLQKQLQQAQYLNSKMLDLVRLSRMGVARAGVSSSDDLATILNNLGADVLANAGN